MIACGGTHTFAGLMIARLIQGVGACMDNQQNLLYDEHLR